MDNSMNEMGRRILEKKSLFSPLKGESGQGMTEYILIAALAVAIILGLMSQFYKPFGNFTGNLMGPYLSCLLDVGELPSFGSTGQDSVCRISFEPGDPRPEGTPGGPDRFGSPTQSSAPNNVNLNEQNSNSGGAGASGGGGSSDLAQKRGFEIGKKGGADSDSSGANSEMTAPLSQSRYYRANRAGGTTTGGGQRINAVGVTGLLAAEKRKMERRQSQVFKASLEDTGAGPANNKKMIVKPQDRKVANDDPQVSWSFGQWLKYAVILLIIIALVLFLGGQILQVSKSMEK